MEMQKEQEMANKKVIIKEKPRRTFWNWFWAIVVLIAVFLIGVFAGRAYAPCKCVCKRTVNAEQALYSYQGRDAAAKPVVKKAPTIAVKRTIKPARVQVREERQVMYVGNGCEMDDADIRMIIEIEESMK